MKDIDTTYIYQVESQTGSPLLVISYLLGILLIALLIFVCIRVLQVCNIYIKKNRTNKEIKETNKEIEETNKD